MCKSCRQSLICPLLTHSVLFCFVKFGLCDSCYRLRMNLINARLDDTMPTSSKRPSSCPERCWNSRGRIKADKAELKVRCTQLVTKAQTSTRPTREEDKASLITEGHQVRLFIFLRKTSPRRSTSSICSALKPLKSISWLDSLTGCRLQQNDSTP